MGDGEEAVLAYLPDQPIEELLSRFNIPDEVARLSFEKEDFDISYFALDDESKKRAAEVYKTARNYIRRHLISRFYLAALGETQEKQGHKEGHNRESVMRLATAK